MYVELLQRCKQMYLTEAEAIDDHLYQLPSFLQSIASVIFHIDRVSGVFRQFFFLQLWMYKEVVAVNLQVFLYLKYDDI